MKQTLTDAQRLTRLLRCATYVIAECQSELQRIRATRPVRKKGQK